MKRFLQIFFTLAIFFAPNIASAEDEYMVQELLDNEQKDEVLITDNQAEDLEYLQDEAADGVETEFKIFEDIDRKSVV